MSKKKGIKIDYTQDAQKGRGKTQQRKTTPKEKQILEQYAGGFLYKCEDCGEIHELEDEYEFGAHDEYEEVDCEDDPCSSENCDGWNMTDCMGLKDTTKQIKKRGAQRKARTGQLKTKSRKSQKAQRESVSSKTGGGRKGSTGRRKKSFGYTSEPIPDYIMRALQPKKSVHPEYGKLRY